jgi:predicted dehydrogenase
VRAGPGVDVRFVATMRFPGDVLAHFDCAMDVPRRQRLEAVGSDASIFVPNPFTDGREGFELRRGDDAKWIEVESADRYREQLANFAAAIRGEAQPVLDRADSVNQARTLAALLRSAAEGRPERLGSR